MKYVTHEYDEPIEINNGNELAFFIDTKLEKPTKYLMLHVTTIDVHFILVSSSICITNTKGNPIRNERVDNEVIDGSDVTKHVQHGYVGDPLREE